MGLMNVLKIGIGESEVWIWYNCMVQLMFLKHSSMCLCMFYLYNTL